MATFDDFKKLELKIAKILSAERVEGSEKLLKLQIDVGEKILKDAESTIQEAAGDEKEAVSGEEEEEIGNSDTNGEKDVAQKIKTRQLIAGIGKSYSPEELVGMEIVIIANLEPRKIMGLESQGMLLAAGDGKGPILIVPQKDAEPGTKIS